jgi:hypothetical protein
MDVPSRLGHEDSQARSISINQRKIILLVFEFSGFSHSLGQNQTPSLALARPVSPGADIGHPRDGGGSPHLQLPAGRMSCVAGADAAGFSERRT